MRALLEKACLVNAEHAVLITTAGDDLIADQITQRIRIPTTASQKRLHPIRPNQPSLLRHLPTGLPRNPRQQAIKERPSQYDRLTSARPKTGASRSFNSVSSHSHPSSAPDHPATPIAHLRLSPERIERPTDSQL
jgi:hypothetical protein